MPFFDRQLSGRRRKDSGISILEMLVVLAVLALLAGAMTTSRIGPSAALRLQGAVARVQDAAAQTRAQAITSGEIRELRLTTGICDGDPVVLTFFPDGTATPTDVCLNHDDSRRKLFLDPLTARLSDDDHS